MLIRIRSLIGLTVLSVFGSGVVNAAPTENNATGHWYEVFLANGITWDAAKAAAESKSHMDVQGHLATITSEAEDVFVESLRFAATQPTGEEGEIPAVLSRPEIWVGGFQTTGSEITKGEGWIWVNSEGAISTPDVSLPSYSNWQPPFEPNDNTGPGSENHLAIGLFGPNAGWNDEGALGNIGGYVVEYDVPRQLEECEVSEGGCVTIAGHTLEFPDGSSTGSEEITFNDFEFTDNRVCGVSQLVIFGLDTDPDDERPSLIIPPYLCGSPKFVVIELNTGGFVLEEGTVLVTNNTALVLPGNIYPDGGVSVCEDPIPHTEFTDGDPQYQDVVVWQTIEPGEMLETIEGPNVGGMGQFAGAAGEFTIDCGSSSRARTKGGSYFVIGLHIDFGAGNTYVGTHENNFIKFVALTRYKIKLLQQSVLDAEGFLNTNAFKQMKKQINQAIKQLDKGNFIATLDHINNFLIIVDEAIYMADPQNFNGEHLMRGGNIEFMLRVKVIPYSPEALP